MPPSVFVSYDSEDSEIARYVCEALEQVNITSHAAPRDVAAAVDDWRQSLFQTLLGVNVILLLVSSNTANFKAIEELIRFATQLRAKVIQFSLSREIHLPPSLSSDSARPPVYDFSDYFQPGYEQLPVLSFSSLLESIVQGTSNLPAAAIPSANASRRRQGYTFDTSVPDRNLDAYRSERERRNTLSPLARAGRELSSRTTRAVRSANKTRKAIFHWLRRDLWTVNVLFASNRGRNQHFFPVNFTGERSKELSFGTARVHVPKGHKIGKLEAPRKANWLKLRLSEEKEDPSRHFVIEQIGLLDRPAFTEAVQSEHTKTALLFVHGYNMTFRDGLLSLAQLVWDIQFQGVPILFSWPSRAGYFDYFYDQGSALHSRDAFGEIINLLRNEGKIKTLHIVAHSMGNFVTLEALSALAPKPSALIEELVMAAPDVDVDLFENLLGKVEPLTNGMMLYASTNDRALVVSRTLARKPRAGDVFENGPITMKGLDSIDVSAIGADTFGLNHSTFATNRSLLDDLGRLLKFGDRPPSHRTSQIHGVPVGTHPPRYWKYAD